MRFLIAILTCSFLTGLCAHSLRAEESPDAEAKEAQQEEEEQKKKELELDHPLSVAHTGTLTMKSGDEKLSEGVIGYLTTKDKVFQIKVAHSDVQARLTPFDGKKVRLEGNLRNKGKYLIVSAVQKAE